MTKAKRPLPTAVRLALIALFCLLLGAPPAPAEDDGIGGFFSHLFGGAPSSPPAKPTSSPSYSPSLSAAPRKVHKRVRDFVPATTTRAAGAPGGAPAQRASFHIYVLGDSLAVLAGDGLADAFADKPEIGIVNKAREASGLVRDDYYDWPKAAAEMANGKDKIDFAVVMLGTNDILQNMRDDDTSVEPLSDRWSEKYGQRVEAVAAPFHAAHIPLVWVGLPPMGTDHFSPQAIIKLNEIIKEHAESAGAKYIDIWDAFSDANGQYDAFGPNIDGQNVKLRGVDGIHFTKAGARKLAHFLEADIHKVYDKVKPAGELASLPPDIEQAADDINAQIRREMGADGPSPRDVEKPAAIEKPLSGPIASLTARPMTPGAALAARDSAPFAEAPEVLRVLREGEPVDARPGRADDFQWPRG
jgi:hypothetical protein